MLEKDICIQFVNLVKRVRHLAEKEFLFFHVPNEFDQRRNTKNYNFALANMGRVAGVADYVFVKEDKCIFIEFKSNVGIQSKAQKEFQHNCKLANIPYYLARSSDEGFRILEKEGFFKEGKVILN